MPAQALTTEFLATLPGREPASGAVSYFDTEIKGFLLEHRASGGATFYFRYRDAAGKVRLNRIGRAGGSEAARPAPQLRQFPGQRRAVAVRGAETARAPRPEGDDALRAPLAAGDAGSGQRGGECCGAEVGGGQLWAGECRACVTHWTEARQY